MTPKEAHAAVVEAAEVSCRAMERLACVQGFRPGGGWPPRPDPPDVVSEARADEARTHADYLVALDMETAAHARHRVIGEALSSSRARARFDGAPGGAPGA